MNFHYAKVWHIKKKNLGLFIQKWNLNYFATEKSGRALIPHPSSPTQAAGRQRGNYALWSHSIVAHMRARETISVLWHSYGVGFVCAGIVLLPKRGSVNPFLYYCCCLEPDSSTVHNVHFGYYDGPVVKMALYMLQSHIM